MKNLLAICAVAVVILSATGLARAVTWNTYGVHGGSISLSGGQITAIAGNTVGETPDYHWNKSNWTARTGEKAFYVTSDLNGQKVESIISFTWDVV
ncbi:MAG: hypothetical protein ACYS0H_19585, partial [Planctomycetota bacterium]